MASLVKIGIGIMVVGILPYACVQMWISSNNKNMREVGEPVPPPAADVDFVELETAAF